MKNIKKGRRLSHFLFLLIAISLFGIIYLALKDFMLTPAQQFEVAQSAEKEGSYKRAERYYLMVINGQDKNASKLASYYLGSLYRKGAPDFPISGKKAILFLEQAAQQGLPQAQYELAVMYDVGDKIKTNRSKAVAWMNTAAQQGYTDALYGLGVWIERGYLGNPDMTKVVALYERAAAQNHVYAITSLIALYSGGLGGFPADAQKASYWMNKLAEMAQPQQKKEEEK